MSILSTWRALPIRGMLRGPSRHPWALRSNRKIPAWSWSTTFVLESFFLTDAEAPFVAEICRKLDGMPLAIELAAGQVAVFGLKNTVARLVSRLELLRLSHRTAVARHRTLKATLDWSYNLLSDAERIVLRRAAPFVGHFTLEAARYVAGEPGAGAGDIFEAIAGLVEKSLI